MRKSKVEINFHMQLTHRINTGFNTIHTASFLFPHECVEKIQLNGV